MERKYSVLIVEDTTDLWRSLNRAIRAVQLPFEVIYAANYREAIEELNQSSPDLVICDYYLPESRNGLEIWKYCKGHCPMVPFLLISGMQADQYLRHVSGLQNYPAFLSKPFTIYELATALTELIYSKSREHRAA